MTAVRKLTVLSGWSGSGKSTEALGRFWASAGPLTLIEADRSHLEAGSDATGYLIALALWHRRRGQSVIVDAVNLHPDDLPRWKEAAERFDEFEWVAMPTSFEESARRDALREYPVGREAIASQGKSLIESLCGPLCGVCGVPLMNCDCA